MLFSAVDSKYLLPTLPTLVAWTHISLLTYVLTFQTDAFRDIILYILFLSLTRLRLFEIVFSLYRFTVPLSMFTRGSVGNFHLISGGPEPSASVSISFLLYSSRAFLIESHAHSKRRIVTVCDRQRGKRIIVT